MKHTEDALLAAAEAVAYEVKMLCFTASALPGGSDEKFEDYPSFERNVYLESFLIHARVLDEFFRSKPRHDDIVATDYVPGFPSTVTLVDGERTAIDKQLAHLTERRRERKSFRVQRIARALVEVFLQFSETADKDAAWYWILDDAVEEVSWWLDEMKKRQETSAEVELEDIYTGS